MVGIGIEKVHWCQFEFVNQKKHFHCRAERSAAASLSASNSAANSFERFSPNQSGYGSGGGISFWKSPAAASDRRLHRVDYSPVLKNLSYSLSTRMPETKTGPDGKVIDDQNAKPDSGGGGGGGGGATSKSDQGICYRVGIDPLGLVSWMQVCSILNLHIFRASINHLQSFRPKIVQLISIS